MRVLVICRYKPHLTGHAAPFIIEQYKALQSVGTLESKALDAAHSDAERLEVELFPLKENYLKQWKALRKKIREWKPDVIHAHYGLTCLVANIATRKVPVVSTFHGSDINNSKARRLSKIAIGLSAWNIFVSKRNVDIAKPKKRWSLIPCGVNLPQPWSELKKQKVEQLTLNQWVEGVLEPNKKHVLFAGAFDNAVKDPELAKAAVALMDDVQLIELKGYNRDQVNALMYSCDALLMTSKTEGSPQVIKEAMACGCPIVSVDVGDVAEQVEGLDGCYIAKTREPEELAELLKKAIAFGKTKGHQHIKDMRLDNVKVAERLIEIYRQIIK